jgi:hypothetical protein
MLDLERVHAPIGVEHHDIVARRRGKASSKRRALARPLVVHDDSIWPKGQHDVDGAIRRASIHDD